ncbi:MAG: phosphopantetheine-binding protein [Bacteroidia bacterium]|nr:phosphopantetheine-binding protein [Bacteroidia bacterium]
MDQLKQELKEALIKSLNLEDVTAADIVDEEPLFGDGLGLDSIDALEIILILERSYGIRLAKPEEAKEIFFSINTLADYISKNRKK